MTRKNYNTLLFAALTSITISTVQADIQVQDRKENTVKKIENKISNKENQKFKDFLNRTTMRGSGAEILKLVPIGTKAVKGEEGWVAVFTMIDYKTKDGMVIKANPYTVFTNKKMITERLFRNNGGIDLALTMKPSPPKEAYIKERLLAGDENATEKIVVFADPLCSFCKEIVPALYEYAKKEPKKMALYYFASSTKKVQSGTIYLTALVEYMKSEGNKDFILKAYKLALNPNATLKEVITKAMAVYPEDFKGKTVDMLSKELIKEKYTNMHRYDKKVAFSSMATGTPILFSNGEYVPDWKMFLIIKRIGENKDKK